MARGIYKMRTICDRTGFSPALLRAWERRHGLLDPERTDGGHRLYTEDDLRVLQRVRQLIDQGRSIGEVASLGRGELLGPATTAPQAPSAALLPGDLDERLQRWGRAFVEGAVRLDASAIEGVLDEAFALATPDAVLARLVEPALHTLGDLWAQGRCSVASEHLASHKVSGRLLGLLEASNPAARNGARPAICACLPDEQHQIGALSAAYLLTRHGYRVAYLGAALPLEDLERACRLLGPEVVCLSVSREAVLQTHAPGLADLVARVPGPRFLLGGQGVTGDCAALERAGIVLVPNADLERALRSPHKSL